jgi:hypothetical protein
MKQAISTILALLGVMAVLFIGTHSNAQEGCTGGKMHIIHVSEGAGGAAELTYQNRPADAVHVCNGDQIQWVLKGSDREFLIEFLSGAPFAGGESRGSSQGVVLETVDAEPGEYDYGINFVGDEPVDPTIIVDS